MNDKKQKLLLEYLISSSDTYALCSSIVKSRYFDPEFRGAIDFIHKYYDEFHKTPTPEQIEAESGGVKLTERQVTSDQLEYTTNEIEKFCKERAIEAAITDSTPLISKGDFGGIETLIRNAVTVSLNRNMGTDYFRDPDGRLKKMSETGKKISTGWKELDKWLYGGMERGQLIIFSANSGGGKSVALSNLGLNFLEMGLNVVYFSFELSEDLISQRYDTMVSGIQTAVWEYHKGEISQAVLTAGDKNGHLLIREMYAGTKPNELRAYLKEYELLYSRTPDLIIVDYLDIMNPNERVSIHQGHVAGGISKVNTSDVWISVHASPTMRAKEECAFQLVKTRSSDGEGQMIYLDWTKTIRIKDRGGNAKKGLTLKKDAKPWIENGEEVKQNKGLLDLIDD
jgi:hypothetical protein